MFLSPLIAGGKGIHDFLTLPERIEEVRRKLAIPILENPENKTKNRFVFVRSILEASLLDKLEKTNSEEEKLILKEKHFQRMRKELEMNKQDLEKQPATRADVAILGLALQEIALCLDEHVARFNKKGDDEIDSFRRQNQEFLAQAEQRLHGLENGLEELKHETLARFEKSEKEVQNHATSLAAGIRSLEQEQKRHQNSIDLLNQNLQAEIKKLASKQATQNLVSLLAITLAAIAIFALVFLRH
jgi:DNA repair exonuclease SbcCD ATPase subunit